MRLLDLLMTRGRLSRKDDAFLRSLADKTHREMTVEVAQTIGILWLCSVAASIILGLMQVRYMSNMLSIFSNILAVALLLFLVMVIWPLSYWYRHQARKILQKREAAKIKTKV